MDIVIEAGVSLGQAVITAAIKKFAGKNLTGAYENREPLRMDEWLEYKRHDTDKLRQLLSAIPCLEMRRRLVILPILHR